MGFTKSWLFEQGTCPGLFWSWLLCSSSNSFAPLWEKNPNLLAWIRRTVKNCPMSSSSPPPLPQSPPPSPMPSHQTSYTKLNSWDLFCAHTYCSKPFHLYHLIYLFFPLLFYYILSHLGFPGGTSGKESTCQCRRHKRHGFDPWVRKIPWRKAWQSTPVFLPEEFRGQRSLAGYSP